MRVKSLTNAFNTIKNRTAEQDVELKQLKTERDQYLAQVESLKAEIAAAQTATSSSHSSANVVSESSAFESSSATARKRPLQETFESGFVMPSEAIAKRSRPEIGDIQQADEEISNDLVDMGEQSNDARDRVPSVEQRDNNEEMEDEDIVPEDGGNIDFGDQDYYGVQDTESFPEPPNLAHEEENNDEEQYEDYAQLPNYPQDEEGDDTMGEDEYGDAEDVEDEDDDDDADIHSEQPDEGEEFDEGGNVDEEDSDDDIVVLS
jgi:hypothetical protein